MNNSEKSTPWRDASPTGLAAGPRWISLLFITLLVLSTPAWGESPWPPVPSRLAAPAPAAWRQVRWSEPATPGGGPASFGCPLAPVSAFAVQPHLHKYLDTWPSPGATVAEAWPEYVAEADDDLD